MADYAAIKTGKAGICYDGSKKSEEVRRGKEEKGTVFDLASDG